MATIQRGFGFVDDANAGGSSYDKLVAGAIPDATTFWPVTGGTFDKGLERIDRNDEVRGRRAASPSLPFRARPVMTIPVPAYRSVIEKQVKKVLGGTDTVTPGTGTEAQTHSIASLDYPISTGLPPVNAQLIRDDLNHKMSGAVFNRFSWTFPLDGEGTTEVELTGLYHASFGTSAPAESFTGMSEDVMMLRDAQLYTITGAINEIQKVKTSGVPTGGGFKLVFDGQETVEIKYNATAAEVQTALLQLDNLDSGDVVASAGPLPAAVTLTFGGHYSGRNVPELKTAAEVLSGGTAPKVEIETTTPGTSEAIPDLQGFELTFNNNVAPKFYARRNIVTQSIGTPAATKKLWFPQENKISAAQDVTYAINMGNTSATEELAMDFSRITKFVFEVYGGVLATTPASTELLRVTVFAGVATGGGADALSARDDITSRFEGSAFYSATDTDDIKVEIVNAATAAIT